MGLGSNYVSNYTGKSERMVEMIVSKGAVSWLNFSYIYNGFYINE